MTDCILEAIYSSTQAYINALTGRMCPSISMNSYRPRFIARICLCHDAPRPLCRDRLRPVTASLGSGELDDPLQLSKNIRCFSNAPRLCSSACRSDSAISEGWPVSSAYLTISRWRAVWTAIWRSAGWHAQDAPNATRLAPSLVGSPALSRPERGRNFPSTVAHSADIPLHCSSRISAPFARCMTNGTSREQFAANYAIALAMQRHLQSPADERRRVKAIRQSQPRPQTAGSAVGPRRSDL
jgi:hypothetical protein